MAKTGYALFGLFLILLFSSQYALGSPPEKIAEDVALPSWTAPHGFPYHSKMIHPTAVWPGYGGGSDSAVIHYVRDSDENYYHSDLVMGILAKHGYSVYYWDAYYHDRTGGIRFRAITTCSAERRLRCSTTTAIQLKSCRPLR